MDIREVDFNNDPEAMALVRKFHECDKIPERAEAETFHFGAYLEGRIKAVITFLKEDVSHDIHLTADLGFRSRRLFRFLKKSLDLAFKRTSLVTVDLNYTEEPKKIRRLSIQYGFTPIESNNKILILSQARWARLNTRSEAC